MVEEDIALYYFLPLLEDSIEVPVQSKFVGLVIKCQVAQKYMSLL
jgi:hypothetical protein